MRLKKFSLWGTILMIFVAFTVNTAIADEWPIQGTVAQCGNNADRTYIVIKDINGNYWAANAPIAFENPMLATALTALTAGTNVAATYDTVAVEWLDLFITE